MKKTLTILLSTVTVIALLFAYALPASAEIIFRDDAGWIPNPALGTPPSYYYRTLINYYGTNEKGTCAHVALSSLLTFYDSHHNDRFVPESMDFPIYTWDYGSPGTMYEGDESELDYSDAAYRNYVNSYAPYSTHLYLVSMAIGMGMYDSYAPASYGLYEDQICALLENYLNVTGSFSEDFSGSIVRMMYASGGSDSQDQIVSYMAELLAEGIPVMCLNYRNYSDSNENLAFNGTEGHCMIAYDCQNIDDPNKANILVHTGYHEIGRNNVWPRDTLAASGFDYIYAILWLDTSEVPHYCSDNYMDMCGCTAFEYENP